MITDATTNMIPAIARVWHEGWHQAHNAIAPESLTRLRTLPSFRTRTKTHLPNTRVAYSDERFQGFCISAKDELYQLYVAPNAQGTGTGRALIADCESRIATAGYQTAWLACAIGNTRAARFYEKCGWQNVRTEPIDLETSEGPYTMEIWRFEKALTAD